MQRVGFELIYADTDAVFLKRKDASREDFEIIMNELIKETGLEMTLEFHYKFLVLLYIEADEKMEARIIAGVNCWLYRLRITEIFVSSSLSAFSVVYSKYPAYLLISKPFS